MITWTPDLQLRVLRAFEQLPGIGEYETRTVLLSSLPQGLKPLLKRSPQQRADLEDMITRCVEWSSDLSALIQLIDNGVQYALESEGSRRLQEFYDMLMMGGSEVTLLPAALSAAESPHVTISFMRDSLPQLTLRGGSVAARGDMDEIMIRIKW